MHTAKNTTLFWLLVVGIFLIIFLMWVPQFVQSIKTLTRTVQTQSQSQTSSFQNEWTEKTEEMKKNFDALLKQTQSLTNTTNTQNGQEVPLEPIK